MKQENERIIGLDLGIGSIGWAVIDEKNERIDDLGVRIFSSGEEGASKSADRASQKRRSKRSVHRQNNRSKLRKIELKQCLENMGFISQDDIHQYLRTPGFNPDVFMLRHKGLNQKLSSIDIATTLINFANYRGYKDFYEDEEEKKDGVVTQAMNRIQEIFEAPENEGKWKTIGQMIFEHPEFRNEQNKIVFRNRAIKGENNKKITNYKYLTPRKYLIEEVRMILKHQANYHTCLSDDNIDQIIGVIFRQRDFEEGPGPNKKKNPEKRQAMLAASAGQQKYSGFEEMIGACPFFTEEKRGTQNSQLYDMYVLINTLSQYGFQKDNATISFPDALFLEIRTHLFQNKGEMSVKELKTLCKKNDIEVTGGDTSKRKLVNSKYIAFLCDDEIFPEDLQLEFFREDYFDGMSLSHQMGIALTQNITPKRRENALKECLGEKADRVNTEKIKSTKLSGGAGVSDRYMKEAIRAFLSGEKYGDFQARFLKENPKKDFEWKLLTSKGKIAPIGDPDMIRNPVVNRAINEARKLINSINKQYPGVKRINIELAREMGQSFETRNEVRKNQLDFQKKNENTRAELIQMLYAYGKNIAISDKLILKYTLWLEQDKHCIYSGLPIDFKEIVEGNAVQVDHIIPQSIILDETKNNKVLSKTEENQKKGNRLPMEYLNAEQREDFKKRVAYLKRKATEKNSVISLSRKKEQYLKLEALTDEVIKGFVDRNINDARYISKYVSNILREAYKAQDKDIKIYVLNGAVTSRFRRYWFSGKASNQEPSIYGLENKGRDLHYYHHAVDAIVVANLTRSSMELAQDYLKIEGLKKKYEAFMRKSMAASALKAEEEIKEEIQKSVSKMQQYYGLQPAYVERILSEGAVPSILDDIRAETELRIPLKIEFRKKEYLAYQRDKNKLDKYLLLALEEIKKEEESASLLSQDLVDSINELLFLVYPEVAAITENGEMVQAMADKANVQLKDFFKKKKEKDLLDFIDSISMCSEDEYKERVYEYYSDPDFAKNVRLPYVSFKIDRKYRGDILSSDNPVPLKKTGFTTYRELEYDIRENLKSPYYVRFNKGIGETENFTIYEARSYYCIEVFKDNKGKYDIRGIRFVDLYKKNGRLYLKKPLPEGYKHERYLFKNEYIRVYDKKGRLKNNGFGAYRSVKNINKNNVYIRLFANQGFDDKDAVIGISGNIEKVEMSLLGHIEGTIKCGDQSLFLTEKS